MALDIEEAVRVRELFNAVGTLDWQAGSAEPWIVEVLCALLVANDTRNAIEIGGFIGYTSVRLVRALAQLPHETSLTVCEIDPARAQLVQTEIDNALRGVEGQRVRRTVVLDDSHRWIPTLPDESVNFVWLDGCHEQAHVYREIELLLPKLAPGGLLLGHDVFGVCDLRAVFAQFRNSLSLDLMRLGPAGGIGLIQRDR